MAGQAITTTSLEGILPLIARGKVRDLYEIDSETLLFVATDRISAFDVVMSNGIPHKGQLLTQLTKHWFEILQQAIPDLKTHFITLDLPPVIAQNASIRPQFQGRSMQVRKYRILPIEAIVRGYITGSAWVEYRKTKTVHGQTFENTPDLQESMAFPSGPIYTPSTKAPAGEKDENISRSRAAEIIGAESAARVERLSLQLYKAASTFAAQHGIIIADTKFEFGIDDTTGEIILVDEVLTPDSSRFWDKQTYKPGQPQDSFDKQFLRDWLIENGLKGKDAVAMPEDIVTRTMDKYKEAYLRLVGKEWTESEV